MFSQFLSVSLVTLLCITLLCIIIIIITPLSLYLHASSTTIFPLAILKSTKKKTARHKLFIVLFYFILFSIFNNNWLARNFDKKNLIAFAAFGVHLQIQTRKIHNRNGKWNENKNVSLVIDAKRYWEQQIAHTHKLIKSKI